MLVIWGLNHIDSNHQQTSRRHGGLRVVALFEAASRHRHDARVFVGEINLIARQRPLGWRLRRLAAGLLARGRMLGVARREFGFILRHLARVAFLGARLDLRACFGDLAQTLLAPRQFVGNRHAIGNVRRVRRLGFGHQLGDLRLQLRLDLARVFIRQRAVLVWTAPDGIDCARMRSLQISDKGDRPWNRLAELGWTRRSIFSSFTG